jgi:hypothetical protein
MRSFAESFDQAVGTRMRRGDAAPDLARLLPN